MLNVDNLTASAGSFTLDAIQFSVDEGEYVVLLGETGAGKSLLLETIIGFHPARHGAIVFNETDITRAPIHSRGLPLVAQRTRLFPHMTVAQNIAYGMTSADLAHFARRVGAEHLLDRSPGSLSGGESQRVALARALATGAQCIVLDEPMSALDAASRQDVRAVLRRLHREGQSFLHVTHDYEEALALATRIGVLEAGKLIQFGSPREVLAAPRSAFLARFVGIRNIFSGTLAPGAAANARAFNSDNLTLHVLTDAAAGAGYVLLRAEDVTLSIAPVEDSARNHFRGTIAEVFDVPLGKEVVVDAGLPIRAHLSADACESLGLAPGREVYVHFKAAAARFVSHEDSSP